MADGRLLFLALDLIDSPSIMRSVLSRYVLIRTLAKLDIMTDHSQEWTVDLGN